MSKLMAIKEQIIDAVGPFLAERSQQQYIRARIYRALDDYQHRKNPGAVNNRINAEADIQVLSNAICDFVAKENNEKGDGI